MYWKGIEQQHHTVDKKYVIDAYVIMWKTEQSTKETRKPKNVKRMNSGFKIDKRHIWETNCDN